jgi:SAM-dependent methyltransferase
MRCVQPDWSGYTLPDFEFEYFPPHTRVLDVGCGRGTQLRQLALRKCHALGIDLDRASVMACRDQDLSALIASAEKIPFRAHTFGGVVCKVVVPYTDEARALREISRLLGRGGTARFCYHGAGYYLRYLLSGTSHWKFRFYALRSLFNTWVYALLGRRMPGFVGDTLYQSRRRLGNYYRACHLRLVEEHPSPTFLAFPVFIYHVVEKVAG